MTHTELVYALALKSVPGIGDILAKQLINYFDGVQQVFNQGKTKLMQVPGIGENTAAEIIRFADFEAAEAEAKLLVQQNIRIHYFLDDSYPSRLKSFPDAPFLLFGRGQYPLDLPMHVGIVGTRKASSYGHDLTYELIDGLQHLPCCIVSGLAAGIDTHAHKAALQYKLPTIGVLAHGLDKIYPSENKKLAERMLEDGGLLTEFSIGSMPDRENFPKRNRIVAGLSDVLVVVETGIKGGARITAEIANSYNKEVMAYPGRVTDYFSQGCNYLIKEHKAACIRSAADLLEWMGWDESGKVQQPLQTKLFEPMTAEQGVIVSYLKQKKLAEINEMVADLYMDQSTLSLQLLELEFSGYLRSLPGKMYELK